MSIARWSERRLLSICVIGALLEGVLLFVLPRLEARRIQRRYATLHEQVTAQRERSRISDSVLAAQAAAQREAAPTARDGLVPVVYTPTSRDDTAAAARLASARRLGAWLALIYVWTIPVTLALLVGAWFLLRQRDRRLAPHSP